MKVVGVVVSKVLMIRYRVVGFGCSRVVSSGSCGEFSSGSFGGSSGYVVE